MQQAAALAGLCQQGECILLEGDLGAGKTSFARGLIQALHNGPVEVTSPTFNLLQTYPVGLGGKECTLWHYDLYRLEHPSELAELGLDDALMDGLVLIEWPEIAAQYLPSDALRVSLRHGEGDSVRIIEFHASEYWANRLREWPA